MRVIATAGHVDHGKSSLVLALTGTDPDRFEEEKRRGLTIDLGFAHAVLPSGEGVSFIDVPGHVRFLRNMLAGVGGIDACVFVVAATEAWKPQSEEHLRILELLGVRHGIVALTKIDAVDDDWRELSRLDVIDRVRGTFLEGAPIVGVSAHTGDGLDELRASLDALVAGTPAARDRHRPRLWIDRVFAAKGSGTVVTGTLIDGSLEVGERLDAFSAARPHEVRVRSIQSLGRTVDRIGPGNRVALNLVGVERADLTRGDSVIRGPQWRPTSVFDASLSVLGGLDHEVSRRGAHVAYIGSGEFVVRLRVLGPESIAPGTEGFVRVHLPHALPLLPGDRFILRESGRNETIGGGEVLDVAPVRSASKARPDRSVDRVILERGWIDSEELEAITGERREPVIGRWVTTPERIAEAVEEIRRDVVASGPLGLDAALLDERRRAVLATITDLGIDAGRIRAVREPDPFVDHPFAVAARAAGMAPPSSEGVDRAALRELVRRGHLVEREGIFFHRDAIDEAALVSARLLERDPSGFTVATFRDETGLTRKHVLPLLGELDARGITRRRDDLRIAGPRLPRVPD